MLTATLVQAAANTSTAIYNGTWLRLSIPFPTSYTCATNCWWSLVIDRGDAPVSLDRTVVRVNVNWSGRRR